MSTDPTNIGCHAILMGEIGTGKTFSIKTFTDAGIEPFLIATEPGFGPIRSMPDLKIHNVTPTKGDWETLIDNAERINSSSNESLQKMNGLNKHEYRQWIEFIGACNNFVDMKTGEEYGDICEFNTDRVVIIDGLTGITKMARGLHAGGKPLLSQPDYGVIMGNIEFLLDTLVLNVKCHLVLITHVELEKDEISGAIKIMVSTMGRKLSPKVPAFFDEAILAYREGTHFLWSTATEGAMTKARFLPVSEKLAPEWGQVIEAWKDAGGTIEPTLKGGAA